MSILLGIVSTAAVFLAISVALLARELAHSRRRIDHLERRQRAHELVIRHLAEASIEPPDEPPPPRHEARGFKRAAVLVGPLLLLVRRHTGRVALAASTGVTAALLAVSLTPTHHPGHATAPAVRSPSSPSVALTPAPVVASARPGVRVTSSPSKTTTAVVVPAGVFAAAVPIGVPTAPGSSPRAAAPSVTLPSVPFSLPPSTLPIPSPSVSVPSLAPSPACLLRVSLRPLLHVCVL